MTAPRSLTRRDALALGSRAAIGLAVGCRFAGRTTPIPSLRFQRAFRVPKVLRPARQDETTDYYEIVQRPEIVTLAPNVETTVWGYEGASPGPTIHARRGRRVVVRHTNQLRVPTSVHLHGGVTPPDSDGFPTDLVPPGTSRTYSYPNEQPAATLWYHDHAMGATGHNVYMGLAGLYLIHDDEEEGLGLPSDEFDVPLVIQTRSIDERGSLHYDRNRNLGASGDLVLVNGVPWPRMSVVARKYRFRILNGSNSTPLELALSTGDPLVQIATDAGLVAAPITHASIPLAMAERVEIIVDFARHPIGTQIVLRNLAGDGDAGDVMRFDVAGAAFDRSSVPDRITTIDFPSARDATSRREFVFAGGPSSFPPEARWKINGHAFDPDRPIALPSLGNTEVWHIQNRRRFGILGMLHPVHVHLVRFHVMERNGRAPGSHESGWKDTVAVPPGDDVTIVARFDGFRGRYLIHCHNLEHEDRDMMARYDVV